jgi:hypothetical protein
MRKWLFIILAALLLLSIAGNVWLWRASNEPDPELPVLREEIARQAQDLAGLQEEQSGLVQQISILHQDKTQLEEQLLTCLSQEDAFERIDRLEAEVRALRRLVPPQAVERAFVSAEKLHTYLEDASSEEYPEHEAAASAQLLALLELVDPGADLFRLQLEVYAGQIAVFFDLDQSTLYIVDGADLGPLEQLSFVHEYVRALHDQLFDLGEQSVAVSADSDRLLALLSLAEGDATLAMQQYALKHLDQPLSTDLLYQVLAIETNRLEAAPLVVREGLLFPYRYGVSFVTGLYDEQGWAGVDQAWQDPPQSTEQILHPERYPDDTPEVVSVPPLTETLGEGWRFQGEDTLGEFLLRLHLGVRLDEENVENAATGWDGDRYAFYTHPDTGGTCLAIRLLWDDEDEAAEFAEIYRSYADDRYGRGGEGSLEEGIWWTGRPGLLLELDEDEVRLVMALDRDLAQSVAEQLGD